jgi:PAP2 superfamily
MPTNSRVACTIPGTLVSLNVERGRMKLGILLGTFCVATILSPLPARSQCAALALSVQPALSAQAARTPQAAQPANPPLPPSDLAVLYGLAPVTALATPNAGYTKQATLGANYAVTGGIQTGELRQPTLLPFPEQQQQALRDVSLTTANLAQLADGLGTSLGAAYLARLHYLDRIRFSPPSGEKTDDFVPIDLTDLINLINYANTTTAHNSATAKYFFANATTDGNTLAPEEALAIFKNSERCPDMFGRAYGFPAGSPGADKYGNSRPFQTEPTLTRIFGRDYFGTPADNIVYNRGPMMDLTNSPSYPSGHTTYGYTGAVLLAVLVPERYSEMIVRGAEYGNDRIIIGAHYAMDVIAGRTLALYGMAHLLADDKDYSDPDRSGIKGLPHIGKFCDAVKSTREKLKNALEEGCGEKIAKCATEDAGRMSDHAIDETFYMSTQTYGLPAVYPDQAKVLEDVEKLAPEAGYLLKAAYPSLSLPEADRILTETEGPGGGFLDDGSLFEGKSFGVYSRLNLYAASRRAAELTAKPNN